MSHKLRSSFSVISLFAIVVFFSVSFSQTHNYFEPVFEGRKILDENGNETGLVNMNPDPDGEPWIAGGLSPLTAEEREAYLRLPKFTVTDKLKNRPLPPTVDNSAEPEFRGIFNQIGGSCGQASGMGYHFTYERNLALGTIPDTKENICAYGFTWNFVNGGSGSGSWPSAGYNIAEAMGCGHVADFNNADNGGSGTAWMNGYEGYYNANDCHVVEQVRFDNSDIEELKNWFYDKGTGSGENGGCITFGSSTSFSISTIQSGPFQGQKLSSGLPSGSSHAMTLAGYSDEIEYDLNGDGKITNDIDITRDGIVDFRDREQGAWQLVNSWGSGWNNSGKVWVLYSGFEGGSITGITVTEFETKLVVKATVTHSSRSSLELTTGFSEDINASSPADTKGYSKAFNKAGGSHPMEGDGGSSTIEIGLDVSEFYTQGLAQGKFFLIAESSSGTVVKMSLMDYTSGSAIETECDQTNVSISGTTYLSVVKKFSPLTTLAPNGGEKWERSRTFDVEWSTYLTGDVKVELLKGGNVHSAIAAAVPASDGVYSWEIKDDHDLGADFKVRVSSISDPTKVDESDNSFTIEEKSELDLTSPNGGEELEKGDTIGIIWSDNLSGNVTVQLYQEDVAASVIAENIPSQSPYEWFIPDHVPSALDYKIRVTSVDKEWLFDESENVFTIRFPLITEYPYIQDFDDFDTGLVPLREYWEQLSVDDLDWTVWTGPTPSRIDDPPDETGPSGDHTSGNGNYLYTEASFGNNPDKKMNMVTPIFDFSNVTSAELSFWYHLFDKSAEEMGALHVDINKDGVWDENVIELSGDKGDQWHEQTFDLTPYAGSNRIQIRFRGVTGQGWHSDISIDDFKIEAATAISVTEKALVSFRLHSYNSRVYYQVPEFGNRRHHRVSIRLYNVQGKLVRTLVSSKLAAGHYSVKIDKLSNQNLAAGLYLCKMEIAGFKKTINVIVAK
ncbi:Ser-Thr-rich GPI-anchored membrane family protein [Fibrobacterota bacterium]